MSGNGSAEPAVVPVTRYRYELGEGPVWSVEEQSLYFVDIVGKAVHRWHPASDAGRTWPVRYEVGSLALCQSDHLAVLALEDGFSRLDLDSGNLTMLAQVEVDLPGNRFNDGKCDRMGRFWAGSMERTERRAEGALWVLGPNGAADRKMGGLICSNGLGWSPDGKTMYHTDSWSYKIMSYDFDEANATLSNPRVFAVDPVGRWTPDGLAVDAEGYVWSAKWDGWRVVRYAPNGEVDRVVHMPVQRPTSCAFGGAELDVLYVTSARFGLTAEQLAKGPLAGAVFALRTGALGLPAARFGM
jgi:sugar lactone lactonase YvrE